MNDSCRDNEGIWLEPLRHAVLRGTGENRLIGAMTRSAAIGNQCTQDRVANAGYAKSKDDNLCRACNQDVGTLQHRFCKNGCEATTYIRHEWMNDEDER